MYCPQCRTELPDDAKFCIKCGYDFARITTPPARKASSDPLDDIDTTFGDDDNSGAFEKGSLFANRYEILDEGKKGGMGAVYKCKDTKLNNEIIALKIIHPKLLSSAQAISRFRQEVAISRKLLHPNIARVHNLEEWDGKEYFTMEWVEGVTLREVIKQRQEQKRPFSMEEAGRIIDQLAGALDYAHHETVHRDIKPENILITNPPMPPFAKVGRKEGGAIHESPLGRGAGVGEGFTLKLTDFGIAKMLSPSQFTTTSISLGTPDYVAPEQKKDAANVDKRADVYALGIVLFELLTLADPAAKETASELNPDISQPIDAVIKKAVASKPENRYSTAGELSVALKSVISSEAPIPFISTKLTRRKYFLMGSLTEPAL